MEEDDVDVDGVDVGPSTRSPRPQERWKFTSDEGQEMRDEPHEMMPCAFLLVLFCSCFVLIRRRQCSQGVRLGVRGVLVLSVFSNVCSFRVEHVSTTV